MNPKSTLYFFLISFFSLSLSAQTSIKEQDYVITYNPGNIAVTFHKSVDFRAFNSRSFEEKMIKVDSTKQFTYILTAVKPAEFITFQYSMLDDEYKEFKSATLAAPSASTGIMNVYFNHKVSTSVSQYQPAQNLGSALDDKLVEYINASQNTLDIAIYNSYSPSSTTGIAGAINNAYNRGVQVRVIYDGSTGSQMISNLNPSIPRLASPDNSSYGIMHNKFVVFDADSSDPNLPWVWSGSTNWTAVQIDGPDKNNAIAIQDQALAQAYKIEFEEMWGSSGLNPDYTLSRFGPYKTNNTPHIFNVGGKVVKNYFSPSDGVTSQIINVINSADSDIEIATMLITRDDIRDALINKYNAGLNVVQGVFDTQNPSGNDIPGLKSAIGANKIVQYGGAGIMHHKFMLIDNFNAASDPIVLTGSHNWSTSAETRNDENTLIIHDKTIADQYYQAFHYLYLEAGGTLASADLSTNTKKVILYPNPTSGTVNFKVDGSLINARGNVAVFNVVGNKITERSFDDMRDSSIDLSNYPKGLYFLNITVGDLKYQAKVIRN